jgi:hypothetical protein
MTRVQLSSALVLLVASIPASGAVPQPRSESGELVAAAPRGAERGLAITDATPDQRGAKPGTCVNPWSQDRRCNVLL